MLGNHRLTTPLTAALTRLREWPVAAQQQARRNAMIAATACAQRRVEREEVDDFLRTHRRYTGTTGTTGTTVAAPSTDGARSHG